MQNLNKICQSLWNLRRFQNRTKLTNWKRQQQSNKQFHTAVQHTYCWSQKCNLSESHTGVITLFYLAASLIKSFLHQIFPVVTLQRQTYITNSPVSLQTCLCFTPSKPKVPSKCKSIHYKKDNAASPPQRPVQWWWRSKHTGVPQMHTYRCVTGCISGRWQHH